MKIILLFTTLLFAGISFTQEERVIPPPPVEEEIMESVSPPPPPPKIPPSRTRPAVQAETVDFPDVEARFPGGEDAMHKYIRENVQYPEIARELGDQGRIYVTFIVERDGSITGVDVMRGGITPELNREAKRVVREMPRWIPAEVKDQPVRARCRLPITFSLIDPKKNKKKK